MIWHDIRNPDDPELDRLAERYGLHPLHIEDCRHGNQTAKVEQQNGYLFVVLKPVEANEDLELEIGDLDVFVNPEFMISVEETACPSVSGLLDHLKGRSTGLRADQLLHRIVDELVDSYTPLLDRVSERIDKLGEDILECPEPPVLEHLFGLRRTLIEMRRVLTNTRDVIGNLQRVDAGLIQPDMHPFFRDVYDHVARNLDRVEMYRDVLTASMEIYLSSVSNRTNQVMKVLAVISTLSLPSIVIAGIYGMNLRHLPFADHPHAWGIVTGTIFFCSAALVLLLKWVRWI